MPFADSPPPDSPKRPPPAKRSSRAGVWSLTALLVFTLAVRIGVLAAFPDALAADPDGYRELAKNVVAHGTLGYVHLDPDGNPVCLPSAWRPPLYPLTLIPAELWPAGDLWVIRTWHVLLGVLTVLGVVLVGRALGLGGYALAAGAWTACDPILLVQSTQVMTETLAAATAVLALYLLARLDLADAPATRDLGKGNRSLEPADEASDDEELEAATPFLAGGWAYAAGTALGLAALCRPTFLAFAALVVFVWFWREAFTQRRFAAAMNLLLGAGLVIGLWAARNEFVLNKPILATTHGGFTRWLADNPNYYRFLKTQSWSDVWDGELPPDPSEPLVAADNPELRPGGPTELIRDEIYAESAARAIESDPQGAWLALGHRLYKFWGLTPHRDSPNESARRQSLRYAIGAWYALQFALAAIGLVSLSLAKRSAGTASWFPVCLLIVAFTYAHAVYWSDLRMRGPIEPAIALLAAAGLMRLTSRR